MAKIAEHINCGVSQNNNNIISISIDISVVDVTFQSRAERLES